MLHVIHRDQMKSASSIEEDLRELFNEKRRGIPQGLQHLDWATGLHLDALIKAFAEIIERECAAARLEAIEYVQGSAEE